MSTYTIDKPLLLHYDSITGKYFQPVNNNRNIGGKIHEFVSKEEAEKLLQSAVNLLKILSISCKY